MPIYEYRCGACNRKSSIFFRSISVAEGQADLVCPRCGGKPLARLFSRFAMVRGSSEGEELYDFDRMMSGVDEDDPRSIARWAKKMGREMGEELGPEFDEAMERIESGEDPESVLSETGSDTNPSLDDD